MYIEKYLIHARTFLSSFGFRDYCKYIVEGYIRQWNSDLMYYYFLVFENCNSSPRLSPIKILYPSSFSKGINETLVFLHKGHFWRIRGSLIGCCSSELIKTVADQKHDSHNANWWLYSLNRFMKALLIEYNVTYSLQI